MAKRFIPALAAIISCVSVEVHACSPARLTPQQLYDAYDLIFIGRAVSSKWTSERKPHFFDPVIVFAQELTGFSFRNPPAQTQYNAPTALYEIQETPEFFVKKEALGLRIGGVWEMSTLLAVADEMLPRLPATLEDVTVDEALDHVAKTFDFIIIFGICEHYYEIAREWREYNARHDDTRETWEW